MTLVNRLGLNQNPFEHYTAEKEPDIGAYAVRPPYLITILERAVKLSSFILFGDRGAGKSATRLTTYKELWSEQSASHPFAVNFTDFTEVQDSLKKNRLSEKELIFSVAFFTIQQLLIWLSSLPDSERDQIINNLTQSQNSTIYALIRGFYFNKEEMDRELSNEETFNVLKSARRTRSAIWAAQRWEHISKIIATAVNALTKKAADDDATDIYGPAEKLLNSLIGESPNAPRAILMKLVELVRIFGFSGVCVLVDKLDETPATSNSSEATAKLIHPLLAHIQLLEVDGFSWMFFVWSNVQAHFNEKLPIRLDKIAHANISWDAENLIKMLDQRMNFFSGGQLSFPDLFDPSVSVDAVTHELIEISVYSPRELVKLLDIILREHDASGDKGKLSTKSIERGINKYCTETIETWYARATLQQVYRVGKTALVNKDVQSTFKIGDQGARVKIKSWEDAGLVKQNGTLPSEAGGKQVYRYEVSDPRVARIINNNLDPVVGAAIEEDSAHE